MADLSCVATIVKLYLSFSASTANVCSTVCVPSHLLTGHSRDLKQATEFICFWHSLQYWKLVVMDFLRHIIRKFACPL